MSSNSLQPSDEQAKVITGCLMLLSVIALAFVFYITKAVLIPFVIGKTLELMTPYQTQIPTLLKTIF